MLVCVSVRVSGLHGMMASFFTSCSSCWGSNDAQVASAVGGAGDDSVGRLVAASPHSFDHAGQIHTFTVERGDFR